MSSRRLKNWLDGYMAYTSNTEPPILYRKWIGISVLAACMQRKLVLELGTLRFYPNMYIVLVGPSGKCRKGVAMGPGFSLLSELGIKMAAEAITREALIRELQSTNLDTAYPDGLITTHSSLTIYSQELTVFLGYNNLQLMSDLTDWYDCREKWTYRTKNQGTDIIEGVWVNLIGATTPDLIQSTLPTDAIGGGLTSRMIFVYEDKKAKSVAIPGLTEEQKALRESLRYDLERILTIKGTFKITDEFAEMWIDWYNAQEGHPPFQSPHFAGYIERRPNHVLKLSMILSMSRSDDLIITSGDLTEAIKLLTETERKMPHTFSGYGKNQLVDVMNQVMLKVGNAVGGRIAYDELMRSFYHDVDDEGMAKIIATMEAMKFSRRVYNGNEMYIEYIPKEKPNA